MGEFDGLLQGVVRQAQAANQPENGDYYDDEGFLVCGNCHTRRQVEVNMPDLKAVPFDPKKKVRVKMPVSCRCRAERRKQEEQMLMQDREMRAAQALKQQSLMDERLRDISFDGFQQTKDNAYNLKLCLRYAKHFDEMLAKNGRASYTDQVVSLNVQPLSSDELQALPEGESRNKRMRAFGDTVLTPADRSAGTRGDWLFYQGNMDPVGHWYECVSSQGWDHTMLSHCCSEFVLVSEGEAKRFPAPELKSDGKGRYTL